MNSVAVATTSSVGLSVISIVASDQRRTWAMSCSPMPRSSAITATGTGSATRSTRSTASPAGTSSSASKASVTRRRTVASIFATARGVNSRLRSLR
jgi:hypothetical protein